MEKELFGLIGQLGGGGAFTLILVKMILDYLKARKVGKSPGSTCKYAPSSDFKKFHESWEEWQDEWDEFQKDYNRHSNFDQIIVDLSLNIRENTKVLQTLAVESKLNAQALRTISDDLRDIRRDKEH